MKQNKKGFTLIELLAVIVILAIIALIATPIILNMINEARKSSAKSSTLGYIDAIEYNNGFAQLGTDAGTGDYVMINTDNDITTATTGATALLGSHLKGKAPDEGSIVVDSATGKVTSAKVRYGNYSCKYANNDATCKKGNIASLDN